MIINCINDFIKSSNLDLTKIKIGVALSGGRDSITLTHALKTIGASIIAINVEHGIRGEESKSDTQFCKDFCNQYSIPIIVESVDALAFSKDNGYTIEQGARILRYNIFSKLLNDGVVDYIALAHHKDDQAETILMRIIRGTGVKGLIGMETLSGKFIRPLLNSSREDINNYIKDNNLGFVEDGTNSDTDYTRNYLREELNDLEKRFPNIKDSFARLSRIAKENEEYINSQIPELKLSNDEVKVPIGLNDFIFKKAIYRACELLDVRQDIEEKHLDIINNLKSMENGKCAYLTHGLIAHKDNEFIVIAKQNDSISNLKVDFSIGNIPSFNVSIEQIEGTVDLKSGLYLDLDKLPTGCVIRYRQEGDYIYKFGGGKKNLGDYLTDKKVPLRNRENIPVIAKENEIFAVFGIDISSKVKIDENTKKIVKLIRK